MRRESAERAIRQWVQSKYFHATLTDDEYTVLLTSLMGSSTAMSTPSIVNDILQRLYPEHENFTGTKESNVSTSRVVPPLASRTAVQAPPQSIEDIKKEVLRYSASGHWEACASEFVKPKNDAGIGSETNFRLVANAIKDFISSGKRLRSTDICDIVMRLASETPSRLERIPEVVKTAPVVEVAPEPDARNLHNRQVRIDRAMNDRSTSPIRGAKEKAQPLLKTNNTNIVESEASEKAARDNATINEAISRISTFTGHSHSRTASGRAQLREAFTTAMNSGKSASEVLAAVEAEASRLSGDSSIR